MGKQTLNLKATSLKTGGVPDSGSKYVTDHGRTSKMPLIADTPRDGGGMSTGETGGNFSMAGMTDIGINAGPRGTKDAADSASDELQTNAKTPTL